MPDTVFCRLLRWLGYRVGWTMGNLRKIKKARRHRVPSKPQAPSSTERIEINQSELESTLERATTTPMSEEEYVKLHAAVETLVYLTAELEKRRVSVQRLKQLLFGATTETTRQVLAGCWTRPARQELPGTTRGRRSWR